MNTIATKQREQQRLKLEIISQAKQSGSLDMAARYFSAIYLLQSESTMLLSELEDLLADSGLMLGSMKSDIEQLNKAYDKFFGKFSKLIDESQSHNYLSDIDEFNEIIKKYAGLCKP